VTESTTLRCPRCDVLYALDGILRRAVVWHLSTDRDKGRPATTLQCKDCLLVFVTYSAVVEDYVSAAARGELGDKVLAWFAETAPAIRHAVPRLPF